MKSVRKERTFTKEREAFWQKGRKKTNFERLNGRFVQKTSAFHNVSIELEKINKKYVYIVVEFVRYSLCLTWLR